MPGLEEAVPDASWQGVFGVCVNGDPFSDGGTGLDKGAGGELATWLPGTGEALANCSDVLALCMFACMLACLAVSSLTVGGVGGGFNFS